MFPDSSIAKNFACGKTKCSCLISFGVAPYFKLILDETLSSIDKFVALFDESFNPSFKTGQMDLHRRFWHTTNNCVTTRYLNSEFIGKASGQDIYKKFEQCFSHCWVDNEQVPRTARKIFEKIEEIIDFWKQLLKSKQPGRGIPVANANY